MTTVLIWPGYKRGPCLRSPEMVLPGAVDLWSGILPLSWDVTQGNFLGLSAPPSFGEWSSGYPWVSPSPFGWAILSSGYPWVTVFPFMSEGVHTLDPRSYMLLCSNNIPNWYTKPVIWWMLSECHLGYSPCFISFGCLISVTNRSLFEFIVYARLSGVPPWQVYKQRLTRGWEVFSVSSDFFVSSNFFHEVDLWHEFSVFPQVWNFPWVQRVWQSLRVPQSLLRDWMCNQLSGSENNHIV